MYVENNEPVAAATPQEVPSESKSASRKPKAKKKAVAAIVHKKNATPKKKKSEKSDRDYSKWVFDGQRLGKGKLVHSIIKAILKKNPGHTMDSLKKVFPDELVPNYGVISDASAARKRSTDKKRYFVLPDQILTLRGGRKIAVTNQITTRNLTPILRAAKSLGISVKAAPAKK